MIRRWRDRRRKKSAAEDDEDDEMDMHLRVNQVRWACVGIKMILFVSYAIDATDRALSNEEMWIFEQLLPFHLDVISICLQNQTQPSQYKVDLMIWPPEYNSMA